MASHSIHTNCEEEELSLSNVDSRGLPESDLDSATKPEQNRGQRLSITDTRSCGGHAAERLRVAAGGHFESVELGIQDRR